MKIALFGGAFDPVTLSHVRVARRLVESGVVDRVELLPCYHSHYGKKMESGSDRVRMCQLAVGRINGLLEKGLIERDGGLGICDYEIKEHCVGETEQIWDQMMRDFGVTGIKSDGEREKGMKKGMKKKGRKEGDMKGVGHRSYYFVIGMDTAHKMASWPSFERVRRKIPFIVVPRLGYSDDSCGWWHLDSRHIVVGPEVVGMDDGSSTQVRYDLVVNRESVCLDPAVFEYIRKKGLYGIN